MRDKKAVAGEVLRNLINLSIGMTDLTVIYHANLILHSEKVYLSDEELLKEMHALALNGDIAEFHFILPSNQIRTTLFPKGTKRL